MSEKRFKSRPDTVLEDPGALAVATLYAQSYLTAAQVNSVERPEEELNSFVDDIVSKHPDVGMVLTSDSVNREQKLAIVDRAIAPYASPFFANFIRVLVQHGRCDLLREIRQMVTRSLEERHGQQRVRLVSARPLSEGSRNRIREQLKSRLGFDPIFKESVDASLIGGMIIQVGDTVYDSSLRSRLKQLRGRLVEKTFNEIQSGRDRFSHPEGD